jgi:hypothetical protein
MAEKMLKDPKQAATGAGCAVGCGVFIVAVYIFSKMHSETLSFFIFLISIVAGMIAYKITLKKKSEESKLVNQEVTQLAMSIGGDSTAPIIDQSIQLMCRATYFGGHKRYGDKADVSVVLTKDRILLKELPGHPETRIDIPYKSIADFGLANKEQLTITRMLLVGILAFALKKKEQYLYVKYNDQLAFENNPVLGEFVGAGISEVSSQLYTLIEQDRSN